MLTGKMDRAVLLLVTSFLLCFLPGVAGLLHGVTKDDLDVMFSKYDVVHPTVVNADGQFISHNVNDALKVSAFHEQLKRNRRSLSVTVFSLPESNFRQMNKSVDIDNDMYFDNNNETLQVESNAQDLSNVSPTFKQQSATAEGSFKSSYIHLNVPAFGSNLHLKVTSKRRLVSPGGQSVIFTDDGGKIVKNLQSNCLFSGKISHHPLSKVAISNCAGLAGLIQTEDDEYFIEPIEEQHDSASPQRHVIYKRSSIRQSVIMGKQMEMAVELEQPRFFPDHEPITNRYESLDRSLETVFGINEGVLRKSKRHAKRNDYNMEVLVAADYEVVRFHGAQHVENYLLTLINIVDEIYHDSSLGEHVNIVLSRLYQLDAEMSDGLVITNNAPASLVNVCRWANDMAHDDPPPHGRVHDYAIFLTRKNFGPAGYAHVTGMCHAQQSCSLNHEDGFSSSFVIAHETGHVLGMEHDGQGNKCGDETSMGSIMAPLVQAAFHRYHWSRCSQQELRSKIHRFTCLLDDPHVLDRDPIPVYPGVSYSLDDQCRFNFGQGYRRCTAFPQQDVCRTLWCSHDDNPIFCKTKQGPPVDGTECGENRWCYKSHCVWRNQRQTVVDGNWGPWGNFEDCSRSCGTGVMFRRRRCNNPAPSHGGNKCLGSDENFELCNKRACPDNRDFRADQCMYRNNEVEYNHLRHKWLPYEPLNVDYKCELYCVSKKTGDIVTMGQQVTDGTLCSYDDPHGVCIRGQCVNVGCDKVVGSVLREDDCGVCGGDGRQCRNTQDRYSRKANRKINNYIKVHKIPQGARHIRITEVPSSDNSNILALKDRTARRYFLNARSHRIPQEDTPYKFIYTGAMFTYDNRNGIESISARGPTLSDITVLILVRRRGIPVQVDYSYILHAAKDAPKARDTYRWVIKPLMPCSVSCGVGYRKAKYGCKNKSGNKFVSKKYCHGRPPRSEKKRCTIECATMTRWTTGEWEECSRSCGIDGIQERAVRCEEVEHDRRTSTVSDIRCIGSDKPAIRRSCQPAPCPALWRTGPWSKCSVTCGEGIKRRQVRCKAHGSGRGEQSGDVCDEEKPVGLVTCKASPCDSETCVRDKSIFCKVHYELCSRKNFRDLCCLSCKGYDGKDLIASQPVFDSVVGVAIPEEKNNSQILHNFSMQNLTNHSTTEKSIRARTSNEENETVHPPLIQLPIPSTEVDENEVSETENLDDDFVIPEFRALEDDALSNAETDLSGVEEAEETINNLEIENDIAGESDNEDDNYYGDDMTDDYVDTENDMQEYSFILSERNESEARPVDTGMGVMLANMKNTSVIAFYLVNNSNSQLQERRKRSTNHITAKWKGWSDCDVKICGVGKRRSLYACWNEVEKKWDDSSACAYKPTELVCVVPCYTAPRLLVKSSRNLATIRPTLECREITMLAFQPRTIRHKCRGIKPLRKNLNATFKNLLMRLSFSLKSDGFDVAQNVNSKSKTTS
ncbi:A disintegrin and metalloproteinase with thrombospondin motifs 3-like isoform X2 [Clavelina lepadiformis]|uniref:A disintegrin and metalloproteinase with thrombospondin motifs 3-like isoform X2 n=1 Tax=Clavelina lepadiformis TaxID=159417 RepID=UPI004042D12C